MPAADMSSATTTALHQAWLLARRVPACAACRRAPGARDTLAEAALMRALEAYQRLARRPVVAGLFVGSTVARGGDTQLVARGVSGCQLPGRFHAEWVGGSDLGSPDEFQADCVSARSRPSWFVTHSGGDRISTSPSRAC